ncbi:MAG: guanylate kinase [Candidatus Omnitrophica bacterium]|nr:guanylate kinase [Candidatus Omnitrophota bacterium]
MKKRPGKLFIISAPSGCGKTTLCERLLERMPRIRRSVSFTTRPPRRGEKNKRDYFFVTPEEFERHKKKNNMLEWARNFGFYYGTPKDNVLKLLDEGTDVVLAIDVKGAMKIKKLFPSAAFIFITPPSITELEKRLRNRKTDDHFEISKRIKIARIELSYLPMYTYNVVNDNLSKATGKLKAIIKAERCKVGK